MSLVRLAPTSVLAQDAQLAIVKADSAPLRLFPDSNAPIVRLAPATLQLQILSTSRDSLWLRVKTGEQKGYQLRHTDRYWIRRQDVFTQHRTRARVSIDVSVLEAPRGHYTRRITAEEFLAAGGAVRGSFYVSAQYTNYADPSCGTPVGTCAQIYYPGQYFLGLGGPPETERPLFDRLYGDSTLRVFYTVTAPAPIRAVHEKLFIARVLMGDAGCYAEDYRGTDVVLLRDTVYTAYARRLIADAVVGPHLLFRGRAGAEIQYVNLMWVLQLTYLDGESEEIVRRTMVWWPKCV
jgi:hypothetical protein